jgi:hypothetical protein
MSGRIICVGLLVEALLSQVLQNDFSTLDILIAWLHCAVSAATVAIILKVLILAESTLPEHISGGHEHLVSELAIMLLEVGDEVKCAVVGRGEPYIVLNTVVGFLHHELSHNGDLLKLLVTGSLQKVDKLLSVSLPNYHRWDADASTSAVIAHNDILDVFVSIVDNYSDGSSDVFCCPHLLYE